MKSAGKARNNGLFRHIRTSKEIIRNLLNDYSEIYEFFRNNAAEYLSDKYFPDFLRGLKNQTMTYSELRFSIMRSRFIEKINQR